ncbi:HNH endonuclease [Nitrosarchaeum sp. AC2]|uniref:HNH endonuclease n=1 Tax=Nitrosarchaeum sp. AC2 TaxID=2259673 RepID=UPI0015CB1C54|nr:HNH endonuclease [Nitrosarchaeum sp. AC2]QLH11018.1 HNH endonuclease [Nitrosarchaeum sp. AC2]
MPGEILSYEEMCDREKTRLVKGINFSLGDRHSIVLMSRAPDAKYDDKFLENDTVLIYDGHDVPQTGGIDTKSVDQRERTPKGTLTQNGRFHEAAQQFKAGEGTAERVKVYENLGGANWIYHGDFFLTDSEYVSNGKRKVFKFKLTAHDGTKFTVKELNEIPLRAVLPSSIMTKVLEQNGRRCHECGNEHNLTFQHAGPNSIAIDNVHIVCNNHNISIK